MRVVGHDLFSSLAVSPDGAVLAGMDWTGTTTLWATSDWQQLRTLGSPDPTPGSVAFSPDGTMFAGAHLRSVSVWHTKTWAETRLVRARYAHGHCHLVLDRTIKLWAVDAGSLESRRSQPVHGWSRR